MGRTQVVSQSARPHVHATPTPSTSKGVANSKLQQHLQQQRPTSSPKSYPNAQVYRPTPVAEHPDDAFMTGAWMFDQSRVPQWMQSQLPTTTNSSNLKSSAANKKRSNATTTAVSPPKQMQQPVKQMQSSKPMNQTKANTTTKHTSLHKVIRPTPVYEHPDTAFFSGAWLFDTARTPLWMQREVPAVASALVVRSRRLAKALPFARTQRSAKVYNVAIPMRKAFGATPYAVIPAGSVRARNAHPDDAFYSGAWMFDAKCAPSWLAQQLKGTKAQQQQQVHVQKQKTSHMQYAGVKLTSGRKLGV